MRTLLTLAILAGCSSSAKQADHGDPAPARPAMPAAAAATSTAPAPIDAGTPASGDDPWQSAPDDPDADRARLRADLDILCSAAKATGGKTVMEIGPWAAEHMQTMFKVELFADIRNTTLDELIARMRKGLARAGLQQCDTLDVLIANDPRQK